MATTITLSEVQDCFAAFAEANGGSTTVALSDDELFMARCVVPFEVEVRPGDAVKGGVAVRGTRAEIEVRPYLLRQVCTNGLIMMQSSTGSSIATPNCSTEWLGEAFASASSEDSLNQAAGEVRSIASTTFDRHFLLATMMRHMHGIDHELMREVIQRMANDGFTGFSLTNALTSVARDAADARTRWRLEAAGGSIPAQLLAGPDPRLGFDALKMPSSLRDLQPA